MQAVSEDTHRNTETHTNKHTHTHNTHTHREENNKNEERESALPSINKKGDTMEKGPEEVHEKQIAAESCILQMEPLYCQRHE